MCENQTKQNLSVIRISQIIICVLILPSFILLNTYNCTQGSIDLYVVTVYKLFLLIIPFIVLETIAIVKHIKMVMSLEIIKIIVSIVGFVQTLPYVINTTINKISLCQGSVEWGGFSNRYRFDSLPQITSVFEQIIPLLYLIIPCALIISSILNYVNYNKN